jgi:plastocyanin
VRHCLASLLLIACGGGESPSAVDASVDIDAPGDVAPDAVDSPVRVAVIGDCVTVTGAPGLTAEVTDTTGYVPTATATLEVGQVARFAYADGGTEHTIVSGPSGAPDGLFASAPFMDHGAFTCIRFDAPGSYPIHCDRHPGGLEQGTITVVAE